jgi:hypothetical protein
MKTHILQPESHDDVISVLDQISWSKSTRVLLVLPKKQHIIHSKKDLQLLARKARWQGAQLGLITHDNEVLELAKEMGVPFFASIPEANSKPWRRSKKYLQKLPSREKIASAAELRERREVLKPRHQPIWLRVTSFLVGVAAMLSLVILFAPRARVVVKTSNLQQEVTMTLRGSSKYSSPDIAGNIPLEVAEISVTGEKQIQTSGRQAVPKTYAQGEVVFTSLRDTSVTVPAGTIVLTQSNHVIRFVTTRDIIVTGGMGSTKTVEIIALQPGAIGNVEVDQIVAVEGNVGVYLNVTNPQPCTGGEDVISPVGMESDLIKLRQELEQDLIAAAKLKISETEDSNIVIEAESPVVDVTYEEIQPGIGMPSEYLQLKQTATVKLLYYKDSDVHQAIQMSMDAILEKNQKSVPGSLQYTLLSEPVGKSEPYEWDVFAVRNITTNIDHEALALQMRGMKKEEAVNFVKQIPGVLPASEVIVYPGFWTRMPYLSFQIEIESP